MADEHRQPWRSLRLRITAAATVAFVVLFALSAVVVIQRINASLEDDLRATNERALAIATPLLQSGVDPRTVVAQGGAADVPLEVLDANGSVIAAPPPGAMLGQGAVGSTAATGEGPSSVGGGSPGDIILRSQTQTPKGNVTVVARSSLENVRSTVDALRHALVLLIPLVAAAIAAIVWIVVDRALRPVEKLRAQVDRISHSTITSRLDEPGTANEIDQLARTMNEMLDRLEASSAQQQRFVADAGHELKTPLATLRSTVEVAQRQAEPDWPAVADRVLVSEGRLESLIDDLLTLARFDERPSADGADASVDRPVVDLEEVVLAWRAATEVDDRIQVELADVVAGRVRGDERELRSLVGNVLDNAVQHAMARVAVSLAATGSEVVLLVDDDGPGIPAAQRAVVFDRFARLQEARERRRARGIPDRGTGLGLAIARATALRHGGSIDVDDSPLGGARFVIRLPAG